MAGKVVNIGRVYDGGKQTANESGWRGEREWTGAASDLMIQRLGYLETKYQALNRCLGRVWGQTRASTVHRDGTSQHHVYLISQPRS